MGYDRILLEIVGIQGSSSQKFRTLFLMLGKLASSVGWHAASEKMIDAADKISAKQMAKKILNEGKNTQTPFNEIITEFARQIEDTSIRQEVLYLLVRMGVPRNNHYLHEAVDAFGLSPCELREAVISWTTFMMLGRIFYLRGSLSKSVSIVEAFMDANELDNKARQRATEFFYESSTSSWAPGLFSELAAQYTQYEEDIDKRRDTLHYLVRIATSTGRLISGAKRDLLAAVTAFELSPDELHDELVLGMRFMLLGKIAKADFHVSEDEVNRIESFITYMEMNKETRQRAIGFFNEGKTTEMTCRTIAGQLAEYVEDAEKRREFLKFLVEIAAADGELRGAEEQCLREVAEAFGLPILTLIEMWKAIQEEQREVQKCYEILGCDPSVSDAELTRCYRELGKQYHPDRISSKNLAPDFLEFATKKFQEIQNAYETITKSRKKQGRR